MFAELAVPREYTSIRLAIPTDIDRYAERKQITIHSGSEVRLRHLFNVSPVGPEEKWLPDAVINTYLEQLADKYQSVLPISTFDCENILKCKDIGFERTLKGKKYDANARRVRLHLWPAIINNNHWVLITFEWRTRRLTIYDSKNMAERYWADAEKIKEFYERHAKLERITIHPENEAVENNDGKHCGVFVLMKAAIFACDTPMLQYIDFRTKIVYELLTKEFIDGVPTKIETEKFTVAAKKLIERLDIKSPVPKEKLSTKHAERLFEIADLMKQLNLGDPRAAEWPNELTKVARLIQNEANEKKPESAKQLTPSGKTKAPAGKPSPPTGQSSSTTGQGDSKTGQSGKTSPIPSTSRGLTSSSQLKATKRSTRVESDSSLSWDSADESALLAKSSSLRKSKPKRKRISSSSSRSPSITEYFDPSAKGPFLESFPPEVEKRFKGVEKMIGSEAFRDPRFQAILRREKRKLVNRKPLSYARKTKMTKEERKREKEVLWQMAKEKGIVKSKDPYVHGCFSDKVKQELAMLTYKTGMSDEERAEPTEGPLFSDKEELQCTMCGQILRGGWRNAASHLVLMSVDRCFQKHDTLGGLHPRANLRRLDRDSLAALYLQKKPASIPPQKYDYSKKKADDSEDEKDKEAKEEEKKDPKSQQPKESPKEKERERSAEREKSPSVEPLDEKEEVEWDSDPQLQKELQDVLGSEADDEMQPTVEDDYEQSGDDEQESEDDASSQKEVQLGKPKPQLTNDQLERSSSSSEDSDDWSEKESSRPKKQSMGSVTSETVRIQPSRRAKRHP